MTVEEARELDGIFSEMGFRRTAQTGESVWYEINGYNPALVFTMLLPDGALAQSGGG